ncbi:MAG: sel1 repeat family protein [Alphaproteobacteria bacterium]|nr:sel1 repeat family protein [Alphaproteobacteria bacterium]
MKKILLFLMITCCSGMALANFNDGEKAFKEQRWPIAYAEFKPLADEGDIRAQYYTGYLTLHGLGTAKNTKRAINYLNMAAAQDSDMAQAMLGYLYSEGIGVKKNKKKSVELYEKAAQKGNSDALLNLGVMYYTGDNMPKDVNKALEYLTKVPTMDKPIAARYLAEIYLNEPSVQDPQKSFNYYTIAARADDINSFHNLGYMYQNGIYVSKNISEAIKFYTYAAAKGYEPSLYALGVIYANGDGVSVDTAKAHAYFSLAATKEMKEAENAKKHLEEGMSLSERNKANQAMINIQEKELNSPILPINNNTTVEKTQTKPKKPSRTVIRRRRR